MFILCIKKWIIYWNVSWSNWYITFIGGLLPGVGLGGVDVTGDVDGTGEGSAGLGVGVGLDGLGLGLTSGAGLAVAVGGFAGSDPPVTIGGVGLGYYIICCNWT